MVYKVVLSWNSVLGDRLVLIRYDLMKNVPLSQFGTFQEENLIFSGRSQTLRLQREENSVLSFGLLPRATHTVSEALSSAQPCSPRRLYLVRVLGRKPGW